MEDEKLKTLLEIIYLNKKNEDLLKRKKALLLENSVRRRELEVLKEKSKSNKRDKK